MSVTGAMGTVTLAATSADRSGTAAWSVVVPANAAYIGMSVEVPGRPPRRGSLPRAPTCAR